jgi:hypothetical protein
VVTALRKAFKIKLDGGVARGVGHPVFRKMSRLRNAASVFSNRPKVSTGMRPDKRGQCLCT